MELVLTTLTLLLTVILIYKKLIEPFKYWRKRDVKYESPSLFLGNFKQYIFRKTSMADYLYGLCVKYSDEPYFGIWAFTKPVLVINDLDLIKEIGVKNVDPFIAHKMLSSGVEDQAYTQNLFVAPGDKWRKVRPSLSPLFTGNKMRSMYLLMNECAKIFTNFYAKKSKNVVRINAKEDIFNRFTTDVTSTCIFGLETDSFKDQKNEFYTRATEVGDFGGSKIYALFGYCFYPFIVKLLNLSIISKENQDFFERVALKAIELRTESAIKRPDMINILMEARKSNLKSEPKATKDHDAIGTVQENDLGDDGTKEQMKMSDLEIVGQFLLFLVAGTDTSSIALTFIAYELAMNNHIQVRLRQEIDEHLELGNGSISYEVLSKMTYMDMVVSEGLRMYPSLPFTDRVNDKPYLLKSEKTGKSLLLPTDSVIWIPIYYIHRDPKYFTNPNKFDPERFSEENRININKDAFMPFGVGPRACIGSRFAILMIKTLMVHILSNFELVPVESTVIPMELSKRDIFLNVNNGLYLGIKNRQKML